MFLKDVNAGNEQTQPPPSWWQRAAPYPTAVLVVFVMSWLLSACNTAAPPAAAAAQIPQITVKAKEYAFDGPAQIKAGLVNINLENEGKEPHHAQLVRLNDGVTLEQLQPR